MLKKIKKIGKRILALTLGLSLLAAGVLGLTGCGLQVRAENLMEGITPAEVTGRAADDAFQSSAADFAVRLFQASRDPKKNSLISPLSVMLALSMTANGAEGETRKQMERLLGGKLTREALNEYWYTYLETLSDKAEAELNLANSIWFKDDPNFTVEQDFLQKNADYYGAAAYKAAFDEQTQKDINHWVEQNTDGLIRQILDKIDENAVMYLVNTVLFEAKWQTVYRKDQVRNGTFTALDGREKTVPMMHSEEYLYLDDGKATGFIKSYQGGCRFAAFLPKEGVSPDEYVASMTGEGLLSAVRNAQAVPVEVTLPKFSYDYETKMNDALFSLGMPDAFDPDRADFSGLGHSVQGNLYLNRVLHKAYIAVDEQGTKAGAATVVEVIAESAVFSNYSVTLDRPFVYAILDDTTDLPLFIGAVTDI